MIIPLTHLIYVAVVVLSPCCWKRIFLKCLMAEEMSRENVPRIEPRKNLHLRFIQRHRINFIQKLDTFQRDLKEQKKKHSTKNCLAAKYKTSPLPRFGHCIEAISILLLCAIIPSILSPESLFYTIPCRRDLLYTHHDLTQNHESWAIIVCIYIAIIPILKSHQHCLWGLVITIKQPGRNATIRNSVESSR